jgi:hypothetical protein
MDAVSAAVLLYGMAGLAGVGCLLKTLMGTVFALPFIVLKKPFRYGLALLLTTVIGFLVILKTIPSESVVKENPTTMEKVEKMFENDVTCTLAIERYDMDDRQPFNQLMDFFVSIAQNEQEKIRYVQYNSTLYDIDLYLPSLESIVDITLITNEHCLKALQRMNAIIVASHAELHVMADHGEISQEFVNFVIGADNTAVSMLTSNMLLIQSTYRNGFFDDVIMTKVKVLICMGKAGFIADVRSNYAFSIAIGYCFWAVYVFFAVMVTYWRFLSPSCMSQFFSNYNNIIKLDPDLNQEEIKNLLVPYQPPHETSPLKQ